MRAVRTTSSAGRWGLLVTTLVMGAALVGSGVSGYLASREVSSELLRARALDLSFAVRRELHRGTLTTDTLSSLLADLEDRGLRYVAVEGPKGAIAAAGEAAANHAVSRIWSPESGEPDRLDLTAPRVRIEAPLGPPRRGRPPMWAQRGRHRMLVLEIDATFAQDAARRALVSLVVSLFAAALLLAAAAFFWRLSRRADRIAAELERDRRLAMLGEMSAVLGHEIRNPLASLKGHAQLLLEKLPTDHPQRRKAETIVREAVRLEELSGHILDFARSGEPVVSDADPAVIARAVAEGAGGRVRLTLEGPLPSVQVDPARIEQALGNVLRNACQASADEPVDLVVRAEPPWLVFEVRDRGPGVPPGDEQRLFEPFYTTRVQGTGLGLAVAHRIVTAHGGRVRVANHPDGGAVFRVELPLSNSRGDLADPHRGRS